jgi:hypothetical protein
VLAPEKLIHSPARLFPLDSPGDQYKLHGYSGRGGNGQTVVAAQNQEAPIRKFTRRFVICRKSKVGTVYAVIWSLSSVYMFEFNEPCVAATPCPASLT